LQNSRDPTFRITQPFDQISELLTIQHLREKADVEAALPLLQTLQPWATSNSFDRYNKFRAAVKTAHTPRRVTSSTTFTLDQIGIAFHRNGIVQRLCAPTKAPRSALFV
jgi:hypothetical protein